MEAKACFEEGEVVNSKQEGRIILLVQMGVGFFLHAAYIWTYSFSKWSCDVNKLNFMEHLQPPTNSGQSQRSLSLIISQSLTHQCSLQKALWAIYNLDICLYLFLLFWQPLLPLFNASFSPSFTVDVFMTHGADQEKQSEGRMEVCRRPHDSHHVLTSSCARARL